MNDTELKNLARALVSPGKGILAADESIGTIEKRFNDYEIKNTVENRRDYRALLFCAEGAAEFISGVILHDETIRQKTSDGMPLIELLQKQGVIPGIKVDKGAKDLAGYPEEKVTEGLDGLRDRLKEYYELGARFAKWRAVIKIGDGIPSDTCLHANAQALGRYAALCQEQKIVPIVEPEVLMDGSHSIERCFEVTERTLHFVFNALFTNHVLLEGMILKPNMVVSGEACEQQADIREIADMTLRCLYRAVPAAVPGIVFLSGGQSEEQATSNLNAMNSDGANHPWELSFSFGRALQQSALSRWTGQPKRVLAASQAFVRRSQLNSMARYGKYQSKMESETNDFR